MTTQAATKNWSTHKIKDFGVVSTGSTPSTTKKEYYGGEYKLISPADLTDSKYIFTSHKLITEEGLKMSRTLPKNAVLVGCIGNIGKIGMTTDQVSAFNQQINAVVCNNDYDSDFVYYLLRHGKPLLESKAAKVTLPILNKSNFENITFEVPELLEQKAIAQTLTTVQNAIAEQEKLIAKLKELKRAMTQHLFTHGTKGEKTKMTEIGVVPESWEVIEFQNMVEFSKKPRGVSLGDNIPFVPMDMVPIDQIFINNHESKKKVTSGTFVANGDILLAKITPSFENGKQGILKINSEYAYATTEVIPFHEKGGVSSKLYLYYWLKKDDVRNDLAGKMEGSTGRRRLSKTVLNKKLIPRPSVDEQRVIGEVLFSVDLRMENIQKKLLTYQNLFKTLLHELMSGELRINI